MQENIKLISDFCEVLNNEIFNLPISINFVDEHVEFSYDLITIKITNYKATPTKSPDYFEADLIDCLCRLRLLIIERYNRRLPNQDRHSAFQDPTYLLPSFCTSGIYLTDSNDNILISY
jgi:hypothetical protein